MGYPLKKHKCWVKGSKCYGGCVAYNKKIGCEIINLLAGINESLAELLEILASREV